jgi:hypothetical protein
MFYRPRWHLLAGLLVLLYAGLSLWVAYAAHRGTIREAVWGGQSIEARIDATLAMLSSIAPFSIANPEHLQPVDDRLNQNYLVGAAVRTTPSLVPFRNGETIYSAVYAFIPRAIWPNKPVVAGSGSYVSDHTLISFAQGTSVGMGQVLEFYINFGMVGLVTGFVLLGMILRYVDIRFVEALTGNDLNTMMVCFLADRNASKRRRDRRISSVAAGVIGAIALSYVLKRTRRRTFEAAHNRRPLRAPKKPLIFLNVSGPATILSGPISHRADAIDGAAPENGLKPPLRILHVIPSVSAVHGGPSAAIVTIEEALAAFPGVEVTTATTDDDGFGRRTTARPIPPAGVKRVYAAKQVSFTSSPPALQFGFGGMCENTMSSTYMRFSRSPAAQQGDCLLAWRAYVVRPLVRSHPTAWCSDDPG